MKHLKNVSKRTLKRTLFKNLMLKLNLLILMSHTNNKSRKQNSLLHIVKQHAEFPDGFRVNKKVKKQLDAKINAFEQDSGIDWGLAEILTFGSLFLEGTPVRISGQDSKRGTFSHRHAVLYDTETRERYTNLLDLSENQAQFCVHNSLLSEAAVLGFDYDIH